MDADFGAEILLITEYLAKLLLINDFRGIPLRPSYITVLYIMFFSRQHCYSLY